MTKRNEKIENALRSDRSFMRGLNSDSLRVVVKDAGQKFDVEPKLVDTALAAPKLDKIYFVLAGGGKAKPEAVLSFLKDKGLIWKRMASSL